MIGISINKVSFSYNNGLVLDSLDLRVNPGERVVLLGPNGSGKSTLLKLVSGILHPKDGGVYLGELPLKRMNRKTIARCISVVPQQISVPFAFTVKEVVMLGRIPYLKPMAEESAIDREIADSSIESVHLKHLINRRFDELSGGERQRVILAMALAQQPELLLLDEPTIHLDINHQVQILELAKRLNIERGITIIAAIHDLNLASIYFNRLILLNKGKIISDGSPEKVITKENIEKVFGIKVNINVNTANGIPQVSIGTLL